MPAERLTLPAPLLRETVRRTVKPVTGRRVPVAVQRRVTEGLALTLPGAGPEVTEQAEVWDGVPVLSFTPPRAREGVTVLYFHGGGYVIGSPRGYAALTSRLALAAGARVLSVDYRRAPEHRFPAAHEDAATVLAALLTAGQDPASLWLAGDSAGGGLALACALNARGAGASGGAAGPGGSAGVSLAGLVLFSPWVDLTMRALPPDPEADALLSLPGLRRWAALYADDLEDPRVSPGFAALAGLPRTLVQYDTGELLAPSVRRFIADLRAAGTSVEVAPSTGLWHVYELFTQLAEARAALEAAGAFIRGAAA